MKLKDIEGLLPDEGELFTNFDVSDDYAKGQIDLRTEIGEKSIELDVEKILRTVILNALETKINKTENKTFVFVCCGKLSKKIELRGQCPHCNKENTEVINLWKYDLAQAIVKADIIKVKE